MSKAAPSFKTVVVADTALSVAQYKKLKEISNSNGQMALGMLWYTLIQDCQMREFDEMGITPVVTIWHEKGGAPIVSDCVRRPQRRGGLISAKGPFYLCYRLFDRGLIY